ncbi:MAG: oxidoreductase, partial [Pseudomonadota bacterium]|nr:oxidoreductase [Pseudomonadota bacterium]
MSPLFEPLQIGTLQLANRIIIAPMCQYSATEGSAGDWHLIHLGHLALSGAGLVIVEATAVSAEGRITAGDLGLYSDANEAALARVLGAVRANSSMPIGMQLAHAGRKASSRAPWQGGAQVPLGQPGSWAAVAPSALAHSPGEEPPVALDAAGLEKIRADFAAAARRAARLGL